jgi:hypothetical protein
VILHDNSREAMEVVDKILCQWHRIYILHYIHIIGVEDVRKKLCNDHYKLVNTPYLSPIRSELPD